MSYRELKHPKPVPRRSAVDIATPVKLWVHNGTSAEFAFPCWYQEIHRPVPARLHDRHLHDHHGWPNPRHPDHSCQLWIPEKGLCVHGYRECHPHCKYYIDYKRVFPIHLLSEEEGYSSAAVKWLDEHEGINVNAWIDPIEDWVVRVSVDCQDPKAIEEPQKYRMTTFVMSEEQDGLAARRDIVALAELIVLPSAYDFSEESEDESA